MQPELRKTMKQETAVKLLVMEGTPDFNRAFRELRAWGYEVTGVRDSAAFAAAGPAAFDLVCAELGPDPAIALEAIKKVIPGPGLLAFTTLKGEALDAFLSASESGRGDFAAILKSPPEVDQLIFAIEEALARREAPEAAAPAKRPPGNFRQRRRDLEDKRLSDFLARNAERNFFPAFPPVKAVKEKKI